MRARKLVLGQDLVLSAMKQYPNCIVFLASDAGDNITKKINDKAETFGLLVINHFSRDELSKAVGKEHRTVILVVDKGFNKTIKEYLNS